MTPDKLHLRLPATSANLGPGLDTAAIALDLYLDLTAEAAPQFSIDAVGRNADACRSLENNMLLATYQQTLQQQDRPVQPLHLEIQNGIPFGMGCGSSAAARLAGVALATHFGGLHWDRQRALDEACRMEGHPDNVAACWMGGMTIAAVTEDGAFPLVHAASFPAPSAWSAMLVLPSRPLPTPVSRLALPEVYARQDALTNLQRASLLVAAVAQERGDLLQWAMQDKLHQPYRQGICPLLPLLAPMAGHNGVLGVALSGAGPAVLLILDQSADQTRLRREIQEKTGPVDNVEILPCGFAQPLRL